ncbi:MAG: filamentous hemagglutinin N-terminal domain-containing protein [Thiotrichaceae bacterium]
MKAFYLIYLLFIYPSLLYAEVVTDGSLGARVELTGKNFEITPELGKQMDHNLFHSFDRFSLQAGESATFSGPSQIQNIIARVTGGSPSSIDGTLRSTIPEADLYLINPYGILFGKDAKLDLQGGFHATTADELRFQDGLVFNAHTPQQSALLSVAPIQAFGFLTDTPAAIQLQDSYLNVLDTHTLSLIGGDLNLKGDFLKDTQGERVANGTVHVFKFPTYAYTAELKTTAGRIQSCQVLPVTAKSFLQIQI